MQADEEELKSSRSKGENSRWTGQHTLLCNSPPKCLSLGISVSTLDSSSSSGRVEVVLHCDIQDEWQEHWAGSSGSSTSGYVASNSWWMSSCYKSKWYRKKGWGRIIYKVVLRNRTKGYVKLSQHQQTDVSKLSQLFGISFLSPWGKWLDSGKRFTLMKYSLRQLN